jgi:hypothetical protein
MSASAVPAIPASMTIPAVPGQVREARAFVFPVKAARERFGDARLDYILIQWAGRAAVLSAEVIDGRLPGGTGGSDRLAVLAEPGLDALAGEAPEPGG